MITTHAYPKDLVVHCEWGGVRQDCLHWGAPRWLVYIHFDMISDFQNFPLPQIPYSVLAVLTYILVSLEVINDKWREARQLRDIPVAFSYLRVTSYFFRQRKEKQLGLILYFQHCPNQSRDVLNFLAFSAIFALITKMS